MIERYNVYTDTTKAKQKLKPDHLKIVRVCAETEMGISAWIK